MSGIRLKRWEGGTTLSLPSSHHARVLVPSFLITVLVPLRWGNIPLDDAVQFNHLEVVKLLQDYQDTYAVSETQVETAAMSKENLESMV